MASYAENGKVSLCGTDMDYIRFGRGEKFLVILPGLGDGLRSVKGTALPMALMYRLFAGEYTVYMFSRRNGLPQGSTTRDMARELAQAMDLLGIRRASVLGVSMGGMIAQYLAIDCPEKVDKLILTVTCARPNPILEESLEEWMDQAKRGDHAALMDSNVRRIYSDRYYRNNKWLVPIMGAVTKPRSYERFLIQARACLTHDAFGELSKIRASTLVIGGRQDCCLGGEASEEIARQISGARLIMYEQWGHGLYEEAKDFNRLVLDYLRDESQ